MVDYLVINNNISYANIPFYTVYIIHSVHYTWCTGSNQLIYSTWEIFQ